MSSGNGAAAEFAEFIPHEEFRNRLPHGAFRVIMDPVKARQEIRRRLMLLPIVIAAIGAGILCALAGHPWWGGGLVFIGIAVNRLIARAAGRILLQLALQDARTYALVTQSGIMEVRRA